MSTVQKPPSRLEREMEREREQRQRNDEARTDADGGDQFRVKDARASAVSGNLQRSYGRWFD